MHLILLWELFQETEEKTKATMHSREKDKKYILESTDWTKLFFFYFSAYTVPDREVRGHKIYVGQLPHSFSVWYIWL